MKTSHCDSWNIWLSTMPAGARSNAICPLTANAYWPNVPGMAVERMQARTRCTVSETDMPAASDGHPQAAQSGSARSRSTRLPGIGGPAGLPAACGVVLFRLSASRNWLQRDPRVLETPQGGRAALLSWRTNSSEFVLRCQAVALALSPFSRSAGHEWGPQLNVKSPEVR
jgi:hypothetical protein